MMWPFNGTHGDDLKFDATKLDQDALKVFHANQLEDFEYQN